MLTDKKKLTTNYQLKQAELEPIEEDDQVQETWKDKYDLEHRLRQEAEGETKIVKAIGMNSPEMKAAKQKIGEMQNRTRQGQGKKIMIYITGLADLTDPARKIQKARESGL